MVVETLTALPREVYMLLAAVLGGVLSIGGSYLLRRHQRRVETQRLKRAIAVEIRTIDIEWIQNHIRAVNEERPSDEILEIDAHDETIEWNGVISGRFDLVLNEYPSLSVYDENVDKIGLLSKPQIEAVIDFYHQADLVEAHINRVLDASMVYIHDDNEMKLRMRSQNELDALKTKLDELMKQKIEVLEELDELE